MARATLASKVWGELKRYVLRTFQNERTAVKHIERQATKLPKASPRYPTEAKIIADSAAKHPEIRQQIDRKHEALASHLNKVRVLSHDVQPAHRVETGRPRPQRLVNSATKPEDSETGFYEPPADKIPSGKFTLREVVKFLNTIQDSSVTDVELQQAIKEHFGDRIDPNAMRTIMQYVGAFRVSKTEEVWSGLDAYQVRLRPGLPLEAVQRQLAERNAKGAAVTDWADKDEVDTLERDRLAQEAAVEKNPEQQLNDDEHRVKKNIRKEKVVPS